MVNSSPKAARKPSPSSNLSSLDRWFSITQRGSTIGREVRGGLVTFFTMAYIIALNPIIIGTSADKTGMLVSGLPLKDATGATIGANVGITMGMVAAATALIAGLLTILMGTVGRFPIGIATGLGLNAMVAGSLVRSMTWAQAMGLIVWEGLIITALVLTGFRTAVFKAVPRALRTGISVGIGLFIAFIGLVDAGFVRATGFNSPPVELGIKGDLLGWPIAVFILGFFLLVTLFVRRVKGAMLIAIVSATVLAVVVEAVGHIGAHVLTENPTGWSLNVPALSSFSLPNLGLLGRVDMVGAFFPDGHFSLTATVTLLLTIFALLLSDFFDTMGTIVAVGAEGDMVDEQGNVPHTREILLVDSIAAVAGGLGSVSSNTSYIESAAGVGDGARTGLASVVTGAAFLVSMFLAPLVFVGFLMLSQVIHVDWESPDEGIPAFLTMVLMPFTYSITNGIGAGFISYVLIKAVRGKLKEVHPLLIGIAIAFLVYFFQGVIKSFLG